MFSAPSSLSRPAAGVLADLVPGARARSAVLVVAGTLLVAAASQIRVPLGFTPVPVNLATFAVALTAGALGLRRGVASMGLYLALGIVGLPFFADAGSGWEHVTGATGGYLVGYVVMAAVIGLAADRGLDRSIGTFIAAVAVANVVLYLLGAAWLGHVLGVPFLGGDSSAFALGVRPFLIGDALKMVAVGLALPSAWQLLGEG